MRSTEDFWGIFWIGFHGGRKGKISPALKMFPAREKKNIYDFSDVVSFKWLKVLNFIFFYKKNIRKCI
jgi:hypothetical protein